MTHFDAERAAADHLRGAFPDVPVYPASPPTLVEFLLARIAEDEAAAEPARKHLATRPQPATGLTLFGDVVYDPARVLSECEAKRRIVDNCQSDGSQGPSEYVLADIVLCCLALPYADHEDFREEWRP